MDMKKRKILLLKVVILIWQSNKKIIFRMFKLTFGIKIKIWKLYTSNFWPGFQTKCNLNLLCMPSHPANISLKIFLILFEVLSAFWVLLFLHQALDQWWQYTNTKVKVYSRKEFFPNCSSRCMVSISMWENWLNRKSTPYIQCPKCSANPITITCI